jgi:hypothetical protein
VWGSITDAHDCIDKDDWIGGGNGISGGDTTRGCDGTSGGVSEFDGDVDRWILSLQGIKACTFIAYDH